METQVISGKFPKIITKLPGPKAIEVIESDSRYISPSYTRSYPFVVRSGSGAIVVSVAQAEQDGARPVLGVLSVPGAVGEVPGSAIEVVTSIDDRFAFVADEYANEIAV